MKEYYHISPDPENIPILFPPDPNNGLSSSEADVPHCVAISPHKKLKKRIAIIGAGAMGSLFASRIAANSKLPSSPFDPEVWLVSSWAEHIEKVNKQGLTVEEDGKPSSLYRNLKATASVREVLSGGPVDVIFVCVKAPYTRVAAEKVGPIVKIHAYHQVTINAHSRSSYCRCNYSEWPWQFRSYRRDFI